MTDFTLKMESACVMMRPSILMKGSKNVKIAIKLLYTAISVKIHMNVWVVLKEFTVISRVANVSVTMVTSTMTKMYANFVLSLDA